MRIARVRGSGLSYYHVISRVIERRFAPDRTEKERLRQVDTADRELHRGAGADVHDFRHTILAHRDQFGLKRRSGPRKLRNVATPGLFTMRDLRLTPIAPSG